MVYDKLVKALTRSTLMVSLLLFSGGCSSFRPGPAPYKGQECAPEPMACETSNVSLINAPEYVLEKVAPPSIALGQNFEYRYRFMPRVNAKDVIIEEIIPDGFSYVSSTPDAQNNGQMITWSFPAVKAGECIDLCMTLKAEDSGCFTSCASVSLVPIACATTFIGEPLLIVSKECTSGPCVVGDTISFDILVKNTGNFPANDVVLTDFVPEGLTHASGKRELTLNVGTLNPGESQSSNICFLACERGEYCNTVKVTSCNAASQEATACCTITKPGLGIEKTGTAEQLVGKEAQYLLKVKNIGDAPLQNVLVTDLIPPGVELVDADGGSVHGREIHWSINLLPVEAEETFNVTLRGCALGTCCNEAAASLCDGQLLVKDSACTTWSGIPDLCMRLGANPDCIRECDEVTHFIEITNNGTDSDEDVQVIVKFTDHLEPFDANGPTDYRINGSSVEFAPLPALQPNSSITYKITTQAAKNGDARMNVTLSSKALKSPINMENRVQVY